MIVIELIFKLIFWIIHSVTVEKNLNLKLAILKVALKSRYRQVFEVFLIKVIKVIADERCLYETFAKCWSGKVEWAIKNFKDFINVSVAFRYFISNWLLLQISSWFNSNVWKNLKTFFFKLSFQKKYLILLLT